MDGLFIIVNFRSCYFFQWFFHCWRGPPSSNIWKNRNSFLSSLSFASNCILCVNFPSDTATIPTRNDSLQSILGKCFQWVKHQALLLFYYAAHDEIWFDIRIYSKSSTISNKFSKCSWGQTKQDWNVDDEKSPRSNYLEWLLRRN